MIDNDIKKALECCCKGDKCVGHCPFHNNNHDIDICTSRLSENALDLINRLEKENNGLFLELEGVMWSVDKWLDGDELKQDKVNRAITMREKTLRITEKQEAEIEKLNVELVGMRGACESYKMHYDNAQAEIERLQSSFNAQAKLIEKKSLAHDRICVKHANEIKTAKSEAIKEFAERLKQEIQENKYRINDSSYARACNQVADWCIEVSNNLVKEMTEVQE